MLIQSIQKWAAVDMMAPQTQCTEVINGTFRFNSSYPDSDANDCNNGVAGDLWGLSCTWAIVVVFVVLMLLLIELWFFEVGRTINVADGACGECK